MRMEVVDIGPGLSKAVLTGRLDIGGSQEIDLAFDMLAASCRGVVVDLSGVTYIASLGLRLLIVAARAMQRKGGRMVLFHPTAAVESVLVSSGTDHVAPILRNLDEAIRAVAA